MKIYDLILPSLVAFIFIFGKIKGIDIFNTFIEGAKENFKVAIDILPSIILLMMIVGLLYSSGAVSALSNLLAPITKRIGLPEECIPLWLLRPFSGGGALSIYDTLLKDNSPDSFVGRVASIMMGSSETTFYTIAIYFSACKIKATKSVLFAALIADFFGFFISTLITRLYFY